MLRTSRIVVLACLALAAMLTTTGCTPDLSAQAALTKGNKALAAYAKAEATIAAQIAEAAAVQPTPEGVQPGIAQLAAVDKAMVARNQDALTAKAQFEKFRATTSDAKEKGYADRAIALADGLLALDAGTVALTTDMTALYQAVAKNSSDTARVIALADAVTKGQVAYEKLRVQVKALSDAADEYFLKNLAGAK